MRRPRITAALVAVLLTASLAGCTSGGGGGSSAASVADGAGRAVSGASTGGSAGGKAAVPADRSVVTTGTLRLVADAPVRAAQRIAALVDAAGGSVAESRERPGDRASAVLTLRIPSAAFDRTLAAIEREGEVRDVSVGSTDVTAKVTDHGVRIANLRTSIARLQQLLAEAGSSAALVELEGALTDRQTSLEQLLAQQRELDDQVALATLVVTVLEPAAAPVRGPGDFASGFLAGLDGLGRFAAALAVGAGVLLPWAVVLAALCGGAVLVARRVRRRAPSA